MNNVTRKPWYVRVFRDRPQIAWLWWLPIVILGVATVGVALTTQAGLPHDDAFITFTYARNLAEGRGFTYNGGEPHLGTTTPLLTLLLAAIRLVLPAIAVHTIAIWLGALFWVGALVLAFLLGRRLATPLAGVAMAGLLMSIGILPHILPTEYPLLLAACLAALHLTLSRRYWLAGAAFGLAWLARGDAAILAGLVGLTVVAQYRRVPWGLGIAFVLTIVPWCIYSMAVFGSPLPATLAVKLAHRAVGAWPPFVTGFQRWVERADPGFRIWLWGLAALTLVGLMSGLVRRRWWLIVIVLWGVVYFGAYWLLDVHFYFWYGAPLYMALALGAGLGLGYVTALRDGPHEAQRFQAALRGVGQPLALLVCAGLLVVGSSQVIKTASTLREATPGQKAYVATGHWLAANTPSDSTVGFIEVGIVGYFSERQIIDLLGLVTPGIAPFLLERDHAGIVQAFQPDYYIRNTRFDAWSMNAVVHESAYFQSHYKPLTEIRQEGVAPIVVYQRVDGF